MTHKAFVFDFDDTLAETSAKIRVIHNGEVIRTLNSHEYAAYQLNDGETFCFREFTQETYVVNSTILSLGEYAWQLGQEGHPIYILTARQSTVAEAIRKRLAQAGITVKIVFCVGGPNVDVAAEKRKVLMTLIENYDIVYFYDDDERNVEQAKEVGSQIKAKKVGN